MKARLAKAAFEVIAERGHSAFRTAAVATRAGVSEGALVHHFATKDGLTLAAIEYAFAEASEATERIIRKKLKRKADPLVLLIEDFRLFFMGDNFWVSLGITMDGSKDPELAAAIKPIVVRYRGPLYQRWVDILADSGWSREDAASIVRMTAALVSGLGMRTLWDDVAGYLDPTFQQWRNMIALTWPRAANPPMAAPSAGP